MAETKRNLTEADAELAEYFTSAIGLRAVPLERASSGGSLSDTEEALLEHAHRRALERYRMLAQTFAAVGANERRTLTLIYGSGAGALSDEAEAPTMHESPRSARDPLDRRRLLGGERAPPDPLGLLRLAVAPRWGRGTFMRLVATQKRAVDAFSRRHPARASTIDAVLDYLAGEAGKGKATEAWFAKLTRDCEVVRDAALSAYELIRLDRVKASGEARRERQKASEAAARERVDARRRRDADEFETRLRKVAS